MLLVVDDDPRAGRALLRLVKPRELTHVGSTTEARVLLADLARWSGIFVDVSLPEGPSAGIELARWIRGLTRRLPVAFFTGRLDRAINDAGAELGVTVLIKPSQYPYLAEFLRASDAWGSHASTLAERARALGLTERESEYVVLAAAGVEPLALAERTGTAQSTVKSHRENIRRKTGGTLEQVAIRLLAELAEERQ